MGVEEEVILVGERCSTGACERRLTKEVDDPTQDPMQQDHAVVEAPPAHKAERRP